MKKLSLGLMLSFISIMTFACSNIGLGECADSAYFVTHRYNPNSTYKLWITGTSDTLLTIVTGDVVNDSVFSLPVSVGTSVEMLYYYTDPNDPRYIGIEHYDPAIAASNNYCGVMPSSLSNFEVQRKKGDIIFSFIPGNETGIKKYSILGSNSPVDNIEVWNEIDSFKATGASKYIRIVPISSGILVSSGLLFALFIGKQKVKRSKFSRSWLGIVLMSFILLLYSCQKEYSVEKPRTDYEYFKVATIDQSGVISYSPVASSTIKP